VFSVVLCGRAFAPKGLDDSALGFNPGTPWSLDISKDGFRTEAKVLARNLVDAAEVYVGKPQLELSKASAVECILSRRDSMIVARHEVPGKASLKRTSRRVRYDRAQLIPHPT
jgi:hypothetical protein